MSTTKDAIYQLLESERQIRAHGERLARGHALVDAAKLLEAEVERYPIGSLERAALIDAAIKVMQLVTASREAA